MIFAHRQCSSYSLLISYGIIVYLKNKYILLQSHNYLPALLITLRNPLHASSGYFILCAGDSWVWFIIALQLKRSDPTETIPIPTVLPRRSLRRPHSQGRRHSWSGTHPRRLWVWKTGCQHFWRTQHMNIYERCIGNITTAYVCVCVGVCVCVCVVGVCVWARRAIEHITHHSSRGPLTLSTISPLH